MANRMSDGMTRLARRLIDRSPTTVVYRRGQDSVTLTVLLGDKVLSLVNEYGDVQVERTDMSPLIVADELILGGVVTEPQLRDRMEVTRSDGTTETYEVLSYADEPHRRPDPYRRHYKVHMKLVRTEAA